MRSRRKLCDRTVAGRTRSFGRLLLAAALLLSSGCQLNRSFFQMDSNSKVPFFGVDLAPRWPRRETAVDGVSRLQNETAHRSQPASADVEKAAPPAKPLALPLSESVVTSTSTQGTPDDTFR